ncbi:hypothetical protein [Pyramidobacter sp.]|uniref:hypothetical protein n=1 Tax=Pyramidobacter sp. TaxID=1943581 RepID=UPI0025E1F026|nr:hypothetical protein [Pyramidobacter sp.]MCI7403613.1 hypothetical protein [Pyramidobacter sp.]MDY3211941.1 hypothetical protein [Pyramidobacter sp.]
MSAMFTQLAAYFQYPFVRYAFIVGVLVALCAAAGIVVSVLAGTPVGSTIVAGNILVFLLCAALGRLKGAAR